MAGIIVEEFINIAADNVPDTFDHFAGVLLIAAFAGIADVQLVGTPGIVLLGHTVFDGKLAPRLIGFQEDTVLIQNSNAGR